MNSIALIWRQSRLNSRRSAKNASRYMPSGLSLGQTSAMSRIEVRPPSLRHAPVPLLQRLMFWLVAPSPQEASPPLNRLPGVQQAFRRALLDVRGEASDILMDRISRARSLRELWHMRLDVYNQIALSNSEFEAAQRLAELNCHFPTRAPRLGSVGSG
jgi:hypothetical protein